MSGPHLTNFQNEQYGQEHHGNEHKEGHKAGIHHFSERNYLHFDKQDRAIWRSGAWHHEKYKGRFGWWWVAGGTMYFYEEPVFPYPQEVPEIEYELPADDQSPQEYTQEPPSDSNYWYYCKDPEGYYPNITDCPDGWMKVVPPPETPEE
jgi:hypothetical protein